jgi:hypothetical protein
VVGRLEVVQASAVGAREIYAEDCVGNVRILLWRRRALDAKWRVTFLPDHEFGEQESNGHTYSPGDHDLPDGYPGGDDPGRLLEWARGHADAPRSVAAGSRGRY